MLHQLSENVFCYTDTCHVYVLRNRDRAVLIDFGAGEILDHLGELGIEDVVAVLMTHHHRDQGQGLARAVAAGIPVWVPPVEVDLFAHVDEHWRTRVLDNDYDLREDKFSLLESVEVAGTVLEYRSASYADIEVYTLPTPGHTVGSVTYLVSLDGRRWGFCGDLVHADGKVWSLGSMQWSYTGIEGLAAAAHSMQNLRAEQPDTLLPAHGAAVEDPAEALDTAVRRLRPLIELRLGKPWDPASHAGDVWEPLTPHLLRNRIGFANTYALISESGTAALFDFGYDATTGMIWAADRATRRPMLTSLRSLRRDHGVDQIEAVLPTHYHDDHVAGFNLLRDVEGTRVWSPETVAPVLQQPRSYDLPCLWYDPIPCDEVLGIGTARRWREYDIAVHDLPGHTVYAVAYSFEVDGYRVVVSGDQQDGGWVSGERAEMLNFQYRNGFHHEDYVRSARLYQRLQPDLMVSGHWSPRWVDESYLAMLVQEGERLAQLHRELLPLDEVNVGRFGLGTRIEPYRSRMRAGVASELTVHVRNPLPASDTIRLHLLVPAGWHVDDPDRELHMVAEEIRPVRFSVRPLAGVELSRARVAVDLTAGSVRFGQLAEALVDVHR